MIKVYCIKQCYLPMRAICISMRRSAASSGRQKRHTALEQTNLFWNHPGVCCLPQAVALFHCAWTVPQPLPAGTFATPPTILEEADIDVNSDESNCENFILNCSRNCTQPPRHTLLPTQSLQSLWFVTIFAWGRGGYGKKFVLMVKFSNFKIELN